MRPGNEREQARSARLERVLDHGGLYAAADLPGKLALIQTCRQAWRTPTAPLSGPPPPLLACILRLIARQRQKLDGMLVPQNRQHELLADAGIRMNVPVADVYGQVGWLKLGPYDLGTARNRLRDAFLTFKHL